MKQKQGFTLAELLLTIAIGAVLGSMLVVTYDTYRIRSDLNLAAEQTTHLLRRAQLKSQTGDEGAPWGVRIDAGTLFAGSGYLLRNTALDELQPLPYGITVSGISEVYYSMLYGVPNVTGDIILTARNGDVRRVTIASDTLSGPPPPPVQIRVHFDRIKNSGNGSAEKKVFVGAEATEYAEDVWIPLTAGETMVTDSGIQLGVTGLSLQREQGFVRIVAYGGLESGGKEVVDATISIDKGRITQIANEEGDNEGEQPFDGNENEGVGGDEYILSADQLSVQFKTRVTNAGDTILIFWQGDNS